MPPISFGLVGYGQPACDELAAFVSSAKAQDPFSPVTVLVHSNHEAVALRRALARQRAMRSVQAGHAGFHSGLVAIEFWTLRRLADELGSAHLRARDLRPVNDLVLAATIRRELQDSPGIFLGIADHIATEMSLASTFADVRSLRSDQRQQLLESGSERAREIVSFVQRVTQRLETERYYDTDALYEHVSDWLLNRADSDGQRLQRLLGRVVLHLPRALSPNQARLVGAVADTTELKVHLGISGNPEADRPALQLYQALGRSAAISVREWAESFEAAGIEEAVADCVISVTDPDTEVRTVVRSLLEDLSNGIAANDIAVLIPIRDPYTRIITEQLDAAGITWNGGAAQSLAESVVGRFVLNLTRLVVEQQMRRIDVMALLDEAPVRRTIQRSDGKQSYVPVPSAAWERLARAANVVDAADWVASQRETARTGDLDTRLGRFMHLLDAQIAAAESDPETSDARLDRLRADRERCGDLAEFVYELWQRIRNAASLCSWDELSAWLREQVTHYLGRTTDDNWVAEAAAAYGNIASADCDNTDSSDKDTNNVGSGDTVDNNTGSGVERIPQRRDHTTLTGDAEARWEVERAAAQRIDSVTQGLSTLSAIEPVADASLLLRTLQSQLASPHGLSGRVGAGVFVGTVGTHAAVPRQRMYLLGMAEGTYPSRQLSDGLIGDADRQRGALTPRSDRTDAQHRDLLAALACCTGRSTVTIPRGDLRRNAENVPTRWLLPTVQRLAVAAESPSDNFSGGYLDAENLTSAAISGSIPGLSASHSFISGLVQARFPATEAEYDSQELLAAKAAIEADNHWLFTDEGDPAFARGVELWRERQSSEFTRFDGNLSGEVDESASFDRVLSASRLETWATCPRKYLFSYLLGIDEVVEPESVIRLSPIDRGQLIHESLDELLRELIEAASTPADLPGPRRRYSESDYNRLREIGTAKAAELEAAGATGFPLLWTFDRETVLADLAEVLARDQQRIDSSDTATRGHVIASEHRFGPGRWSHTEDAAPAVPYQIEPGRVLLFRGAIDRVERIIDESSEDDPSREHGRLVVIDYKSGSERPYEKIRVPTSRARRPDDPTLRGTRLQLGVYALAAAHHFAPGLAVTSAVHQAAYWFVSGRANWAWVTRHMDEEYFQRFDEVLRTIVNGIESGVFIGYVGEEDEPTGISLCPYCDPDGIGTTNVSRLWQRKRDDEALADFARLAAGPGSDDQ